MNALDFSQLVALRKIQNQATMVFEQLVEGVPTACTTIEEVSSVSFFELPWFASSWQHLAGIVSHRIRGVALFFLPPLRSLEQATALRDGVEQLRDSVPEHMFQEYLASRQLCSALGTATRCMRIFIRSCQKVVQL